MKGNFDGSENISEFRRCIIKRAHIKKTARRRQLGHSDTTSEYELFSSVGQVVVI